MLTLCFTFKSLNTGYLSPQSIRKSPNLQCVYHYNMKEIEAGENQSGTVKHMSLEICEKTSDILIKGGDPHFIHQKGMECDIKWMLQTSKRQLNHILDTTSCLRTDYRSLAEFFGITDSVLGDIEQECSRSGGSCTEAVIRHWTATMGNRMTFGSLYGILTHPGLVNNMEAVSVIETMVKDLGCQVC